MENPKKVKVLYCTVVVFFPRILVRLAPDINLSISVVKGDALLNEFPRLSLEH